MNEKYDFFIAGRTRNKSEILKICEIFDQFEISYYCFLKNEKSHQEAGLELNQNAQDLAKEFENMSLKSDTVQIIFQHDMEAERNSKNFLLVLPAGKSAHIEAGVAYGLGKKCYAIGEYEATDSLYLIFNEIFANQQALCQFLQNYAQNPQETYKNPIRNPQENTILEFCTEPKTLKEIVEYFGYKDIGNFREQYINPLLAQKKLQMVIPDQPNSRNQKYINCSQKFFLNREKSE